MDKLQFSICTIIGCSSELTGSSTYAEHFPKCRIEFPNITHRILGEWMQDQQQNCPFLESANMFNKVEETLVFRRRECFRKRENHLLYTQLVVQCFTLGDVQRCKLPNYRRQLDYGLKPEVQLILFVVTQAKMLVLTKLSHSA